MALEWGWRGKLGAPGLGGSKAPASLASGVPPPYFQMNQEEEKTVAGWPLE
jgi:hypothetical protein